MLIPRRGPAGGEFNLLRVLLALHQAQGSAGLMRFVAPESAVGGPFSLLRDGDIVSFDAFAGELSVEPGVLEGREPILPAVADKRGWPLLHRMHVTQAPQGCDYDVLQARTPDQLPFVEPVIGRS